MRVTVHHGYETDGRMVFGFGETATPDVLVEMYSYEADYANVDEALGRVFRENNAVDGSEYNVQNKARSLSVGDVFVLNDAAAFLVESFGFTALDPTEFQSIPHTTMEDIHERINALNEGRSI